MNLNHGVLLLNKPTGITSMQAVHKVKRILQCKKAGHTGTLDPIATGVLPICLGSATRTAQFFLASEKVYRATMTFGFATDSHDHTGQVTETRSIQPVSETTIQKAFSLFKGTIQQIPPKFSALKVKGKRAHSLARQGKQFELAPRPITIYDLKLETFDQKSITFYCKVSKGTYIRSLIRDLSSHLHNAAHMSALERLQVGTFHLEDTISLSDLETNTLTPPHWKPLAFALQHLPHIKLNNHQTTLIRHGQIPHTLAHPSNILENTPYCFKDPNDQLVALLQFCDRKWKFFCVFPESSPTHLSLS